MTEPTCPAMLNVGDGAETIDLMCWLRLDHQGPHQDIRGDEPFYWQTVSEREAP